LIDLTAQVGTKVNFILATALLIDLS